MPELGRIDVNELPNLIADYKKGRENMWGRKVSKKNELKEIRSNSGILQAILMHLQDPDSKDQDGKNVTTGMEFMNYLESKLKGVNPDSEEEMKAFKQKDPKKFVTLTTAHKAKGLEWGRVFVMQPGAFSPEGDKIRTEEDAQQERNSWYVSTTRPHDVLMVSADDQPKSDGDGDNEPDVDTGQFD